MNMEKFKHEHVEILVSMTELHELVQAGIKQNADSIATLIIAMSGHIKLHLVAEDRELYPALVNSNDPEIVRIGKQFRTEMGGIAAAYMAFVQNWSSGAKIALNPEKFRADANAIFKALHQRVQRENHVLYPLAEKI